MSKTLSLQWVVIIGLGLGVGSLVVLVVAEALWTAPRFAAAASSLEDTSWWLQTYGVPSSTTPLLPGTLVLVQFESATAKVKGGSGCNSYSGDYEVQGEDLSVSNVRSTAIWCSEPESVMQQEVQYLGALRAAQSYELNGDELKILYSGDGVLVFDRTEATLPVCDGLPATIVGTDGADVLEGTDGDDVIVGLRGHDLIRGLAGTTQSAQVAETTRCWAETVTT